MELFNRMTKFAISPDESIAKTDEAKTKNRIELRLMGDFFCQGRSRGLLRPLALGSRNLPEKRITRANP